MRTRFNVIPNKKCSCDTGITAATNRKGDPIYHSHPTGRADLNTRAAARTCMKCGTIWCIDCC